MRYIVAAGGTGGHIYPALTIADKLSENDQVVLIAANRRVDHDIIDNYSKNYQVKYWKLSGFSRKISPKSILMNIINVFRLMYLLIKSFFFILIYKPDGVIGFGGYITFPIVFMASLMRRKTIIHEQNSYPGLVNRILGKTVNKVAISYFAARDYFDESKTFYTSNPRAYVAKGHQYYKIPKAFVKGKINVLVLGGSLGAEKINELVVNAAQKDSDKIYHLVVGKRYYEDYKKFQSDNLIIYDYLNDVFDYICISDIIITRAGASTLLELVAMKSKVIAIPSPNVVANHQFINAQELEKEGLIKVLIEKNLTDKILIDTINMELAKEIDFNKDIININPIDTIVKLLKE